MGIFYDEIGVTEEGKKKLVREALHHGFINVSPLEGDIQKFKLGYSTKADPPIYGHPFERFVTDMH